MSKSVKIDDDKEFMGLKGKIISIRIPKEGKFNGFKLNFFVSNDIFAIKDIDGEIEDQMISRDQLDSLAEAIKQYMEEYGITLSYVIPKDGYSQQYCERRSKEFKKCINSMFSDIYHKTDELTSESLTGKHTQYFDSSFFIKGKEQTPSLGTGSYVMCHRMFDFEPFNFWWANCVDGKVILNYKE